MSRKYLNKKVFAVLLSTLMVLVLFSGCITEEETPAPATAAPTTAAPTAAPTTSAPTKVEPIRVGFAHPFTGTASELGAETKRGIDLAIEEINENGGVLGRPLKIFLADDKCDPMEGCGTKIDASPSLWPHKPVGLYTSSEYLS